MDKISIFYIGILAGAILMAVAVSVFKTEPRAIEVYQGKTTLKYTIVEGVVKDSVVIYKGKE